MRKLTVAADHNYKFVGGQKVLSFIDRVFQATDTYGEGAVDRHKLVKAMASMLQAERVQHLPVFEVTMLGKYISLADIVH
jgi:hypothetical protein